MSNIFFLYFFYISELWLPHILPFLWLLHLQTPLHDIIVLNWSFILEISLPPHSAIFVAYISLLIKLSHNIYEADIIWRRKKNNLEKVDVNLRHVSRKCVLALYS